LELPPRQRILTTACDLFYRYGIHYVGIDWIIKESNVAKMTFYKHFPSKSNLVAAYLDHQKDSWWQLLKNKSRSEDSPLERILVMFDVVDVLLHAANFQGCPFMKALAEFGPDHEEPEIQTHIFTYFREMEVQMSELIRQMKLEENMSQTILSLVFGSMVVAQSTGRDDIAQINKEIAQLLLNRTCSSPKL
jgi:AcrR family transcriptional regulator